MALTDKLSAIGTAIREKGGTTELLTLDQMPAAIQALPTGGSSGGGETTKVWKQVQIMGNPDTNKTYRDFYLNPYVNPKEDDNWMLFLGINLNGVMIAPFLANACGQSAPHGVIEFSPGLVSGDQETYNVRNIFPDIFLTPASSYGGCKVAYYPDSKCVRVLYNYDKISQYAWLVYQEDATTAE